MDDYWVTDTTSDDRDPIVKKVVQKYYVRSAIGVEKYGTTLEDSPDDFYKFLVHLQEELMDGSLYIEKILSQKFGKD